MIFFLRILLTIVEVVSAALLVAVILIQKSKSQGIGLAFGAGMGESLFGAHAGNVLTRATVIIGVVFLTNTALLTLLQSKRTDTSVVDRVPPPAAVAPLTGDRPATPAQPGAPAAPDVDQPIGDIDLEADIPMETDVETDVPTPTPETTGAGTPPPAVNVPSPPATTTNTGN